MSRWGAVIAGILPGCHGRDDDDRHAFSPGCGLPLGCLSGPALWAEFNGFMGAAHAGAVIAGFGSVSSPRRRSRRRGPLFRRWGLFIYRTACLRQIPSICWTPRARPRGCYIVGAAARSAGFSASRRPSRWWRPCARGGRYGRSSHLNLACSWRACSGDHRHHDHWCRS